ncbi:MAG: DUF5689 domain-containing protein [Alistipes sp.]|nr:DUF5689 domain-containing protein [Alistipes senegalensis]MCM1249573.1 DUF5689 domain-containing protein [Alistipes sp.]
MKNYKFFLAAACCIFLAGCYNDFDTPAPAKIWTDQDMEAQGLQQITIKALKQAYVDNFGSVENTGTNDNWATTKTLKIGAPSSGIEAEFPNLKFWEEGADCYIKGKVISSDAQGNVYKSLYIDDGTAAIELKLCGTLYTSFPLDLETMESTWVYVKLRDFYLGNYRMMLSLGDAPSNALNAGLRDKYYANSNFESPDLWCNLNNPTFNRVLRGGECTLDDSNIKVVDASNYNELGEDDYARLIHFKGVKIQYANITYQDEKRDAEGNIVRDGEGNIVWDDPVTAPTFTNGSNTNPFPNWIVTDSGSPVFGTWFYWAYSRENVSLYGSVLMLLNESATDQASAGAYTIRTSGYARFAMQPIPRNGTVGNVLGIYGIYAKSLRNYPQYQITVSRIEDLDFPAESLLSQEWIEHNTPGDSYAPPVKDGAGEYDE